MDHKIKTNVALVIDETLILLEKLSGKLYHMPLKALEEHNPSLSMLADALRLVADIATERDGRLVFIAEAANVMYEAAAAVGNQCGQTLVDCAYHLEDIIGRIRSFANDLEPV